MKIVKIGVSKITGHQVRGLYSSKKEIKVKLDNQQYLLLSPFLSIRNLKKSNKSYMKAHRDKKLTKIDFSLAMDAYFN